MSTWYPGRTHLDPLKWWMVRAGSGNGMGLILLGRMARLSVRLASPRTNPVSTNIADAFQFRETMQQTYVDSM